MNYTPDSIYSKLGNIYYIFYKLLLYQVVLLASHPFWQNFFLHIQNIWTKLDYLLYNINNKIFVFLLFYGSFVLQLYPGTRVQHLQVVNPRNWDFKSEHREWHFWTLLLVQRDCVCVSLFSGEVIHLHKSRRPGQKLSDLKDGGRGKVLIPAHSVKMLENRVSFGTEVRATLFCLFWSSRCLLW